MDAIETHDMGHGIFVEVHYDEHGEASNPREWDQLGVMVCGHPDYQLGDVQLPRDHASSIEGLVEDLKSDHPGARNFHPLYLLDHSGLWMSMGERIDRIEENPFGVDPGGWDTSLVGVIFTDDKRLEETGAPEDSIDQQLEGEVKEYSAWLEGAVYGYVVKQLVPVVVVTKESGALVSEETRSVVLDSCWGFVGETEYALAEGKAAAQHYVDEAAK